MIDMRVREQDFFQRELLLLKYAENLLKIATWIDHCCAARDIAPEYGTVLLEGRDGNDGGAQGHRHLQT
jgi:hypothetical protein